MYVCFRYLSMDQQKLWQSALAELEVGLSRPTFKTWFSNARLISLVEEDGQQLATVGVASSYAKEQITNRYLEQLIEILEALSGKPTTVTIEISQKQAPTKEKPVAGSLFDEEESDELQLEQRIRKAQLNPSYTFENFIVGSSNNLAYTAAQAVVKAPGRIHNPLFIYGGVGCGKTHLMHAVGNAILKNRSLSTVLYTSCEQFTNDLIESLKSKTTEKFRNKYRKLDILIVDDIQFLSKSEYAQEEFFNTFNALYNLGHQIILASDRLPEEIPKLADRLTSRFQGGVIVDVQPPDLEMRIAILHAKAQELGDNLPEDVVAFLAENYRGNTRELEGALKRVSATAFAKQEPITLNLAQQSLGLANRELKRRITPRQIVEAVSQECRISMKELTGKKRRHEIVAARQIAMYLLRTKLNLQYERIAEVLGGKDHTTIMYGVTKVENLLENDGEMRGRIEQVLNALGR